MGGRLRDLSPSPMHFADNDEDDIECSSTTSSLFSRHGNIRAQRLIRVRIAEREAEKSNGRVVG